MLDGYPILGPRDETGRELTNADLDECHGRTGPVTIGTPGIAGAWSLQVESRFGGDRGATWYWRVDVE